jgi:Fe-S-cluster containining protein
MARRLLEIYEDIAHRVGATQRDHGSSWPCKKGCSTCCERLSREPELTEAEWDHLREGITNLEPTVRTHVEDAIRQLTPTATGPVICPMLDRNEGVCLVYEHRPAACRTYGFFARKGDILACQLVVDLAADKHDVVWGNHERIDHDLGSETRSLSEWFDS